MVSPCCPPRRHHRQRCSHRVDGRKGNCNSTHCTEEEGKGKLLQEKSKVDDLAPQHHPH